MLCNEEQAKVNKKGVSDLFSENELKSYQLTTSKTLAQDVAKPKFISPLLHHTYCSPRTHIQQMYFIHTQKIKRKLSSTEYLSFLFWRFIRVQSVSPPLENPSPLSRPHCQFEKAFLSVNGLLCVQYYQLKKIDISRQLNCFLNASYCYQK